MKNCSNEDCGWEAELQTEVQVMMCLEAGVRSMFCSPALFLGIKLVFLMSVLEPRTKPVLHELGDEGGAKASQA